jgi:hypothetical protein
MKLGVIEWKAMQQHWFYDRRVLGIHQFIEATIKVLGTDTDEVVVEEGKTKGKTYEKRNFICDHSILGLGTLATLLAYFCIHGVLGSFGATNRMVVRFCGYPDYSCQAMEAAMEACGRSKKLGRRYPLLHFHKHELVCFHLGR